MSANTALRRDDAAAALVVDGQIVVVAVRFRMHPELNESIGKTETLMLADGMPLVWARRLQATPFPRRVASSELVLSLTAAAAKAGASIFLLGGNPGVGERAAALLRETHRDLNICGVLAPPPGFEHDPAGMFAITYQLVITRPDFIYCCFGLPKQEKVIQQLRRSLPSSWFLGLGGSLSIIAAEFTAAPEWMRRRGLGWIWRLIKEPRRLFRRYILKDIAFAVTLLGTVVMRRLRPSQGQDRIPTARKFEIKSRGITFTTTDKPAEKIMRRHAGES
jgi:N-acetylglucosaminyldiphosphoundecaprenol N-acetyl-beta-D-mannosaminyltransferase